MFVTSIVEKTPTKTPEVDAAGNLSASGSEDSEESDSDDQTANKPPSISLFSNFQEQGKRSATTSPELNSAQKNEKKKKKKNPENIPVRSSSRHGGQNLSKQ